MTTETKAVWHEIDPATLQPEAAKAYAKYKADYALAKTSREAFETAMRKSVELPKGRRLAIAYNFGKLSVANVEEGPAKGASRKATSLALAFEQAA